MKLRLQRDLPDGVATLGRLYVDDNFQCHTLERASEGKGHIPAGTYKVVIDFSGRFQRLMPHVLDVPGFSGVRIHMGNTAASTEGCILVGTFRSKDFVGGSKVAFDGLFPRLATASDEITLDVVDAMVVTDPEITT